MLNSQPLHWVVLDDKVKMVVQEHVLLKHKAQFETIFILELICLQISEDSGSWKVVSQPGPTQKAIGLQ